MTDTQVMAALEPTQADREAMIAYEQLSAVPLADDFVRAIRAGDYDHIPRIQAFARHRLSHSTPGDAEVRKALEWYRDQLCEGFCEGFTPRICEAALKENPTGGDCAGCRAVIALATPPGRAQAWLPIEDAPRDGTEIVAAIKVRHIKGGIWWERHVIAADEETGELHPDYDHGWTFDDYELWRSLADLPDLPAAPPAQDQSK